MYYRQCQLQKGDVFQVTFLPDKFAKINGLVKLKSGPDWVDGWKVIRVSPIRVHENHLPDSHSGIKSHRKKTGDSLPKL